jgi:hypothetical protein
MRYIVRLSQGHRVIVQKRIVLSMFCHITLLHDYISSMEGRQAGTSSGANRPPLFSVVGMMSSKEREGRAFSGPAPNTLDSRTTGLGVKWK